MVTFTYQRQKRSAGATGEPAAETKKVTRRKGVAMSKALLLSVKKPAKPTKKPCCCVKKAPAKKKGGKT